MAFQRKRALLASGVCILAVASAPIPAMAGFLEWADQTASQESSGYPNDGYAADNGAGPGDSIGTGIGQGTTAVGKYQILLANWEDHGYIEAGAGNWGDAVFTDKARNMGVSSYEDLLMSDAGRTVQDAMAGELATSMWNSLNSNATGAIGQTVNGVTINEAGMLGGSWFLGPGAMNTWANGGFSASALANIDDIDEVLAANGFSNVQELQNYLMNRMEEFEGVDISEITDGTYTPGEGTLEVLVECAPAVSQGMQETSNAYVEGIAAAAQDDTMGFSQLQQPFGQMSCIDFAFTGGLDILFSAPSLSDIGSQAMDMACSQVNQMVAEQTGGLTGQLQQLAGELSTEGMNVGPLGNFGAITTSYNSNTSGVNFGLGGGTGGGDTGGFGDTGGVNSDPAAGGFDSLFVQQ
ncbi:hypothetical protein [Salipiger mucosus]|uniref:PE-PGRS family protein n=1 Tax=Salipiger mucosus DSM 16094 TaxID=1123237 RepID=S9S1C1_9RHOB|nr:hypothetical protein [Salipiger mucosus]EPX84005.1 hypothetical protein Salmuc_01780 [Salipiger mucosus DSM 16094]